MQTLSPLKVSLHGMSDREQKLMINYLKMLEGSIDTIVVADEQAQVEILDVDLSSLALLEDRLTQHPAKPIIVLSLHEVLVDDVFYLRKPLQSEQVIAVLSRVQGLLESKAESIAVAELNEVSDVVNKAAANLAEKEIERPESHELIKDKPELKSPDTSDTFEIIVPKGLGKKKHKAKHSAKGNIEPAASNPRIELPKVASQATKAKADEVFNVVDNKGALNNRRKAIRYAFSDLKGYFEMKSLIGMHKRKAILILDISSRGALIECEEGLKLKVKGKLILEFKLDKAYKVAGQVVRESGNTYGVLFDTHHHELNDYLISSGRSFLIKGDM